MSREVENPIVNKLHAEGRHIEAEWTRLKINSAGEDATEENLASHRLSFFLGAVAVWQAIQEPEDDESAVDALQAEMEAFLEDMELEGRVILSDRAPDKLQ